MEKTTNVLLNKEKIDNIDATVERPRLSDDFLEALETGKKVFDNIKFAVAKAQLESCVKGLDGVVPLLKDEGDRKLILTLLGMWIEELHG